MDFTNFFFGKKAEEPKYELGNSLRMRLNGSYLETTLPSTPSSKMTVSFWLKDDGSKSSADFRYFYSTGSHAVLNQGASATVYNGTGSATNIRPNTSVDAFTDPTAWYHVVAQVDDGQFTFHVNGQQWSTQAWAFNPNTNFRIGAWAQSGNGDDRGMFVCDFYMIDGKVLQPTVFANYDENGVWIPRDPEFEVNAYKYSSYLISSSGTFSGAGAEAPQAFDGDTGTEARAGGAGAVGKYIEFAPATEIPFTTLEAWSASPNVMHSYNGVDGGSGGSSWVLVAENGVLSSTQTYRGTSTAAGTTPNLSGLRVDGEILIDGPLYSGTAGDALFYDPQDSSNNDAEQAVDWTTTNPLGQGETNLFDGNLSSAVGPSPSTAVNGCIIWKNPIPVTVNKSLRVYIGSGGTGSQRFYINEQYAGQFGMASPGWLDLNVTAGGLTPPYTLESMGFKGYAGNYSGFVTAIEVDGVTLLNGVGMDYGATGFHLDFSDPNNIGADRSGNGNNFTAYGIDTAVVPSAIVHFESPKAFDSDINITETVGSVPTAIPNLPTGSTNLIELSQPVTSVTFQTNNSGSGCTAEVSLDGSAGSWTTILSNVTWNANQTISHTSPFKYVRIGFSTAMTWSNMYEPDGAVDFGTFDLMKDSPTNNFATINPLETSWFAAGGSTVNSIIEANLTSYTGSANHNRLTQYPQPGEKYYMECVGSNYYVGFVPQDYPVGTSYLGSTDSRGVGFYLNGSTYVGSAIVGTNPSFTTTDVIQLAYDVDTGNTWMGVNGVWHNSGDPATNQSPTYTLPAGEPWQFAFNESGAQNNLNPGQLPFVYEVPEGFTGLSTKGMEQAPIPNGREHFRAITGPGDAAGVIWKEATITQDNPTDPLALTSELGPWNSTATYYVTPYGASYTLVLGTTVDSLTWSLANGFDSGAEMWVSEDGTTWRNFNPGGLYGPATTTSWPANTNFTIDDGTPIKYVRWMASKQTSLNCGIIDPLGQGDLLSTVQNTFPNALWWIKDRDNAGQGQLVDSVRGATVASTTPQSSKNITYAAPTGDSVAWCWNAADPTTSGFNIFEFTGDSGATQAVPHGLPGTPEFIITASQSALPGGFETFHVGCASGQSVTIDAPRAQAASTRYSGVDGTNITYGGDYNTDGTLMIAYAWTSIPGFSAMGTYIGNNNANGPFVYTGFKAQFVMIKQLGAATNWVMYDSTRLPYNPNNMYVYSNLQNAENTDATFSVDFLSNGFKVRGTSANVNASSGNYSYVAWAENPFSYPVTAR